VNETPPGSPGDIPGLPLLLEGVQLVLEQLTAAAGDLAHEARWTRYASRLGRDTDTPLTQLVRRFGLDPFATRCLLLATACCGETRSNAARRSP
jgi:hypothetical protein